MTSNQSATDELIDLGALRGVLDKGGEPHLLRMLKPLEEDETSPSAGFNSMI